LALAAAAALAAEVKAHSDLAIVDAAEGARRGLARASRRRLGHGETVIMDLDRRADSWRSVGEGDPLAGVVDRVAA
jgi:hypothetical protein